MHGFFAEFDGFLDYAKSVLKSVLEPLKSFFDIFSNFWAGAILIAAVFAALLFVSLKLNKKGFFVSIKSPKVLAFCAVMIAINALLEYFAQDITAYIRVSFGFATLPVVSAFFGPIAGCVTGILQDLAGFLIKPTGALLITLTFNEGIAGMIFGIMLYNKKITFGRIFLTELVIIFGVNILLNSIALAPTVGSGFIGILPSRIIKNIIMLPIQSVIVYFVLKVVKKRVKL